MKAQFILVWALLCFASTVQATFSSDPTHVIFVTGINVRQKLTIHGSQKITYFPYLAQKFEKEFSNLKMEEIWHPLSWDITVSAEYLSQTITKAMKEEPNTQFILVGHSKGAVEILLALLQSPEWIESNRLFRVMLLQGAFNGSYLPNIVKELMLGRDSLGALGGLWCLEHGRPIPFIERAYKLFPQKLLQNLSDKIYFLRTYRPRSETPLVTHLYFRLLEKYGPNDGTLLLEDQMVPENLGHDLGVLKAAHMDLITNLYLTLSSRKFKEKFTDELFSKVFIERGSNPFSEEREHP